MESKRVIDRRKIKLEKVMRPDYIPFLGGRPERKTVISMDDVVNLKISLNTTRTIDELLKKM
ncbi:MAG: hypothetical protein JW768_02550 [Chitinispirillaceae bacterium]|nr:hypothetical protein [Chitinispirillaceae bacterium]